MPSGSSEQNLPAIRIAEHDSNRATSPFSGPGAPVPDTQIAGSHSDAALADTVWGAPWTGSWSRHMPALSLLLFAGLVAVTVDVPLARAMHKDKLFHWLHGFLGSVEPFGQPTAIVFTALAIALCDARRRRLMPRLLAASLGAGLAADVAKLFVARVRPYHHDLSGSALSTFQGLVPGWGGGSRLQSFPSAHTATAVGFCLALSTLFPRGRKLFCAAAVLVALQRVEAGAHYLSDVCWGGALGYAVAMLLFRRELLGGWFDRMERTAPAPATAIGESPAERFSIVSLDN